MAERVGFEPTHPLRQGSDSTASCEAEKAKPSQTVSQTGGSAGPDLTEIVAAWPTLAASVRAALLTLVRASAGAGVESTPVSRDTEVPGVALGGFYGREPAVRDVPPERKRQRRRARPAPSPAQETGEKGGGHG